MISLDFHVAWKKTGALAGAKKKLHPFTVEKRSKGMLVEKRGGVPRVVEGAEALSHRLW